MKQAKGGIGILVARDAELKSLNTRFRGKAKPTDVLSFPAVPVAAKNGVPHVHLGDIAISADIAAHNARAYGYSISDEVKILILHGLLHLHGYDHESDGGEMAQREIALRRKLGLPASLIHRTVTQPIKAATRKKKLVGSKTAVNRANSLK